MKSKLLLALFLSSSLTILAQKKFDSQQQKTIDLLETKRKEFKATKTDSLFLVQNSDQGYYSTFVTRGDQAEDIEEQIFNAKPGDVVGPFDGDKTFYLLKLISVDSLKRTKAKSISFFPKGEYTSDTAKFSKLVANYIDYIKRGKEFSKMIIKDEASIGIRNKGVHSYWEGQNKKENFDIIFDKKITDPYVKRNGPEINVIYVIEEKKNAPFRAKVTSLVKKVK